MAWSFSNTSFSSDHLLALWMPWQVSSLWCVWKSLVIRFYDFSTKTCPVILHVTWHNYARSLSCLSMTSGHPQGFWEGVFSVPLRSLARRVRIEKRFVPFKSLNVMPLQSFCRLVSCLVASLNAFRIHSASPHHFPGRVKYLSSRWKGKLESSFCKLVWEEGMLWLTSKKTPGFAWQLEQSLDFSGIVSTRRELLLHVE